MKKEEFLSLVEDNDQTYIVLDTSAWLRIYTYSPPLRHAIINEISSRSELFWIPHQVREEVGNNNKKSMNTNPQRLQKEVRNLKTPIDDLKDSADKIAEDMHKFGFSESKVLKETFDEHLNALKTYIKDYNLQKSTELPLDIYKMINEEDSFKFGNGFSYFELMDIYKEGEFRYAHNIPPGYADTKDKDEADEKDKTSLTKKYGDLIIWKEILNHLVDNKGEADNNVIFVTDERKEDFWNLNRNKITGPRPELINEFAQYSKGELHLMLIEDFYELLINSGEGPDHKKYFELEFDRFIERFLIEKEITLVDLYDKIQWEIDNSFEVEEYLSEKTEGFLEIKNILRIEYLDHKPNPEDFNFYIDEREAIVNGLIFGSAKTHIDYRSFDLVHSETIMDTIIDVDFRISIDLKFDLDSNYNDFKKYLPELSIKSFEVLDVDFRI